MADRVIYKYTRIGDSGDETIEYAPTKIYFEKQQKEDIEMGFRIDEDSIVEINFNANDMESLCDALNNADVIED